MSWGAMFDGSGGFNFDDSGSAESSSAQKRSGGDYGGGSSYKKPRTTSGGGGSYGDSSYDAGYGAESGGYGDDSGGYGKDSSYDNGGGYDAGYGDSAGDGGADDGFGGMSEITSWDQLAPKKPARGGGRGGGRGGRGGGGGGGRGGGGDRGGRGGGGRGGGRGGRGGGGGGGKQFGGGGGGGGYGGGGYGGGGGNDWGSSESSVGAGGNFDSAKKRGFGGAGFNRGGGGGGGGGGQWGSGGDGGGYSGGGRGQRGGSGGGNQQRGRGRGNNAGYNRAFTPGFNRNAASMSLVQKFEKFMGFLRGDTARVNAIQSIENACLATGLHLKCDYQSDELPRIHNRQLFTGRLCISGIFLARCVGCNKKEMKHEIYGKALEILSSKSLDDINELKDPGLETVKASVEKYLKASGPGTYQEGVGVPVYKQLSNIAAEVSKHLETAHRMQIGITKVKEVIQMNPISAETGPINRLEQIMIKSRSGLRHIFTAEQDEINGKYMFEGCFIVEDCCIARAYSTIKKQCKTDTYEAAYEALNEKSLSELVIPVEREKSEEEEEEHVQNEAIVAGLPPTAGEGPPPITRPSLIQAPLVDRLKNLCQQCSRGAFTDNNLSMIDNCVCNSSLTATCIYRRSGPESTQVTGCELYIDNTLISMGFGNSKLECAYDAYNQAFEVLSTMTPEAILANHKKLQPDEKSGPTVLDCVTKGSFQKESNTAALRRFNFDGTATDKKASSMIIVEDSNWHEDRRAHSFTILHYSATMNGMLLQWTFTPVKPQTKPNWKNEGRQVNKLNCALFLNNEKVAEHTGFGKYKIRNFASSDILYKLYETCDVVRVVQGDDSKRWIPFETLFAEANTLRTRARKPKLEQVPSQGGPLDQFLYQAIEQRITTFFPRKGDAEQLIFGPGIPQQERNAIAAYTKTKGLRYEQRQNDSEVYDVISDRPDLAAVLNVLKTQLKTQQGQFKLVDRSECPSHADLTGPKSKGKTEK